MVARAHTYTLIHGVISCDKLAQLNQEQIDRSQNALMHPSRLHNTHGSILGPLLFNINLNYLFFLVLDTDICNIADDNTLYKCDISSSDVISKLESSANLVIDWLWYNYMKLNESRCQLLVCGIKEEVVIANIGNSSIIETHEVKLLGVTIDRELKFKKHVQSIYSKAGKKLNALARLCTILSFNKRKILMNAFVMSQFASSLIGMFVGRTLNSKINALHFRALKIVYPDNVSTFDELLKRDNSVRVHHRNIQFLAIEMFKVKLGIAPSFMNDILQKRLVSKECRMCAQVPFRV